MTLGTYSKSGVLGLLGLNKSSFSNQRQKTKHNETVYAHLMLNEPNKTEALLGISISFQCMKGGHYYLSTH